MEASNDSDLILPIEMVRIRREKMVGVFDHNR